MPPARRWFHQPRFVAPPPRNCGVGRFDVISAPCARAGYQSLPDVSATVFIGISRDNRMTIALNATLSGSLSRPGISHVRHPLCAFRARLKIDSRALPVYRTRSKQTKSY